MGSPLYATKRSHALADETKRRAYVSGLPDSEVGSREPNPGYIAIPRSTGAVGFGQRVPTSVRPSTNCGREEVTA